ncbi:MAG: hypothetical protein ACRDTA_10945 [Pseudonocardiaceae bacterium]
MTRASSADIEVTIPVPLAEFRSEVWLDRAEFEDLIRPRVPLVARPVSGELGRPVAVEPEVVITLGPVRPGLPAGIVPTVDINIARAPIGPAPTTVGFAGSDVPEPAQTDIPDLSSVTTIPLNIPIADIHRRRARSRRFKRFAAAGVLALVGGAASASFITSNNGPILPATAGNPAPAAPAAAIPAPDAGSSTGAPAAAPNTPADGPAPPAAAAVPAPHTTTRSTSRSKPPASMRTPPPRTPEISPEAYVRSRMAELSGSDQSRARLRPDSPPHR